MKKKAYQLGRLEAQVGNEQPCVIFLDAGDKHLAVKRLIQKIHEACGGVTGVEAEEMIQGMRLE